MYDIMLEVGGGSIRTGRGRWMDVHMEKNNIQYMMI